MTVPDRSSPMPVEAVCLTKSLGRGDSRVPVLRGLDLDVGAGVLREDLPSELVQA